MPKRKKYALSVSLEEYFQNRFDKIGRDFGAWQTEYMTGSTSFEEAKEIIQKEYFLCCTTTQLDDCQRLLSRIYKKNLQAKKRNSIAWDEKSGEMLDALKAKHRDLFEVDYKTMRFVRDFFVERRDDIRQQLGVEVQKKPKPALPRWD